MQTQTDYAELGVKVGIEIHRQLDTRCKLYCVCPTSSPSPGPLIRFSRRLRPTQSELGQIDPAALFEFQKGRTIIYEADPKTSCLVEMDEEPPHPLNQEAVDICLTVSALLNADPVDEIHVMRKIVIDGSNTTGFQRSCIISSGGSLKVDGLEVPINQISLEEDAARKIGESEKTITYGLDRLAVPLIEVTTAPVMRAPEEVQKVASAIGRILRATGKVKRGLGSVRQDLNISIRGGSITEVKGVQVLDLIPKVVELEVQRQVRLLEIRDELQRRGANAKDIENDPIDATQVFTKSQSKILRRSLDAGGVILALNLRRFGGLLKQELTPGTRLGSEMAQRAIYWGSVGGIFHTDELPNYGITEGEVGELRRVVNAGTDDCVVFVADMRPRAEAALRAVVERAGEAVQGVPGETRGANPNGSTKYTRPRPGAARMYPETDVPPLQITSSQMDEIKANLPLLLEEAVGQLMSTYSLNQKLAEQLLDSDYLSPFVSVVKETKLSPTFAATTLTEVVKALERKRVPTQDLSNESIMEVFKLIDRGSTAKESISDLLEWLARNPGRTPLEAIDALNLKMLSREDVEKLVAGKIKSRPELQDLGEKAFGKVMSLVMAEVRGRADASLVTEIVNSFLRKKES